ncbi:MAG: hypothetical protein AB1505_15515 [Candidatus Latescibacterota bacterium]
MWNRAVCALGWVLGMGSGLGADTATPRNAVRELEMQVNSRFVTELLGPVDYDFVYYRQGTGAWALADVEALQRWEASPDTVAATAAALDSAEDVATRGGAAGADTSRPASTGGGPTGLARPEAYAFAPDTTRPELHTYLGPLASGSDRRGDARRFDLSGLDVPALLRRPLPAHLAALEGLTLGVRVCPPQTSAAPQVTAIATEHSLAERRLMRRDLRDF